MDDNIVMIVSIEIKDIEKQETFPPSSIDLASSPLWNEQCRIHCTEYKLATYQLNLLRSKSSGEYPLILIIRIKLISPYSFSDSDLAINDEESQIPLIFIHHHDLLSPLSTNSRHQKNDFGSGWDIILPNEWAQIFWISLVYSGARPIGQHELAVITHETGTKSLLSIWILEYSF